MRNDQGFSCVDGGTCANGEGASQLKRTELRRNVGLKRGGPINKVGKVKERKIPWQQQEREAVMDRSRICEVDSCNHIGSEWHHIFLRNPIVGEPWASSRELTCVVCWLCHREITEGHAPHKQTMLELAALARLIHQLKITDSMLMDMHQPDQRPVDLLRAILRWCEKEGIKGPRPSLWSPAA